MSKLVLTIDGQEIKPVESLTGEFCIRRENQPDLVFEGEKLLECNRPSLGHITRLTMYRTVAGKYVVVREIEALFIGNANTTEVVIAGWKQAIPELLGYGLAEKDFYEAAGIPSKEVIE